MSIAKPACLGLILVLTISFLAGQPTGNETYASQGADWKAHGCIDDPNNQSPINIEPQFTTCRSRNVIDLVWNSFTTENITISLAGSPPTVRVKVNRSLLSLLYKRPGVLTQLYLPEEMVFRTPSEHTIRGVQFPMELQVFFRGRDDSRLALSILFSYSASGRSSSIVTDFLSVLTQTSRLTANTTVTGPLKYSFEYMNLFPFTIPYYHYKGTLTDGNCLSNVKWIVYTSTLPVAFNDISTYRTFIRASTSSMSNNRAVHDLGDRSIDSGGVTCQTTYDRAIWFTFFFAAMVFFVFKVL